MPIYEYECLSCAKRFDQLQKLADPDPTDCPSCGEPQLKRALTAAAFRLKGGGWYETDFKGDKDKKRNLVDANDSKTEVKADAKPSDGKADSPAPSEASKADSKTESKVEKPAVAAASPAAP